MGKFSVNKAILVGNLTRDPELRYSQAGHGILTLNMATNHSVKQLDNTYKDYATFHRVVVFGKVTEWLNKSMRKGMRVYVEGRISTREFMNKEGQQQRYQEIVAENVIPMNEIRKEATDPANAEQPDTSLSNGNSERVNPEDVPF